MSDKPPTGVRVASLLAHERPSALRPYVGRHVEVTAQYGRTADQRSTERGRVVALASVYGEPAAMVLVLATRAGRSLAIPLSRLVRVAPAEHLTPS